MYDPHFQNSLCAGSWLHRYFIYRTDRDVIEEVCVICKDRQFFKEKGSNQEYISWHAREALQPRELIFYHEYPQHDNR
jgi:hypothetical protein